MNELVFMRRDDGFYQFNRLLRKEDLQKAIDKIKDMIDNEQVENYFQNHLNEEKKDNE
jgi:hypothetical protein